MTIKLKLLIGFLVCSAITATAVFLGIYSLETINTSMKNTTGNISSSIDEQNKFFTLNQSLDHLLSLINTARTLKDIESATHQLNSQKNKFTPNTAKVIEQLLSLKHNLILHNTSLLQLEKKKQKVITEVSKASIQLVDDTEFNVSISFSDSVDKMKENANKNDKALNSNIQVMSKSVETVLTDIKRAFKIQITCSEISLIINNMYTSSDAAMVNALNLRLKILTESLQKELETIKDDEITKAKEIHKSLNSYFKAFISRKEEQLGTKLSSNNSAKQNTDKAGNVISTAQEPESSELANKSLDQIIEDIRGKLGKINSAALAAVDNIEFNSTIVIEEKITAIQDVVKNNNKALLGKIDGISQTQEKALTAIKSSLKIESNCYKLEALISNILQATDPAHIKSIKRTITTLVTSTSTFITNIKDNNTQTTFSKLLNSLKNLATETATVKLASLANHKKYLTAATALNKEMNQFRIELKGKSDNLQANTNKSLAASGKSVKRQRIFLYTLGIIAVIIAFSVGFYISQKITRPIISITHAAEDIAKGNLNIKLAATDSQDETGQLAQSFELMLQNLSYKTQVAQTISEGNFAEQLKAFSDNDILGKAFEKMVADLNYTLCNVNQSAKSILSSAAELKDASQLLSDGSMKQASSLEEVESSIVELNAKSKSNAEHANATQKRTNATRSEAEHGEKEINAMLDAMSKISDANNQISKILKAIEDIAFQTNILALNAAVEAARAGVHGKGFAVVAEEVRALAGRSAKASQETAALIEASTREIANGLTVAKSASDSFMKIMKDISEISKYTNEIATGSGEQATMIEQITSGLTQIDNVAQQNSAQAEQTAAAADHLSHDATNLDNLLQHFKLNNSPQLATNAPTESEISTTPALVAAPEQIKLLET